MSLSVSRLAFGTAFVVAVAVPTLAARAQRPDRAALLIRGGTVIDGTGAPARVADVAINGDTIVFVGDARRAGIQGAREIDARGLIVAPGFIDPHTHTFGDLQSARVERRTNAAYLMQGVTTVITGNDGGGPVDVADTFTRWEKNGIGTNAALFVGFGSVRGKVLGASSSAPNADQLSQMKAMVAKGVDEGALGLSTGLYYAPQSYATTEEVIALAREAGVRGGVYDSHLRDESSYTIGLMGAIREILRIGKEAALPVHIAHIKALGVDVWGESDSVIALVTRAQRAGQKVTADQYPYTASGTAVGAALLPRWAEAGGRDSLRSRITNPEQRDRLVAAMQDNMRRRGGAASLLITGGRDRALVGKTLEQVAKARNADPILTALEIIMDGDAGVASFNMNEDDIARFMREPWVFTGSDGSDGHPRKYGTYPRKLHDYVLGKKVITLEQMVQRSSFEVAGALGLGKRGALRQGWQADVIVMDTAKVAERATYEQPELLAEGMQYVIVNGALAVSEGKLTGAMAGRGVRRTKR
ncbi:MAG: amidohydrolase family protein [Gemmatimonadetes bacterium]|nr:amidohydrolase family protein [Gemmatimonadota bacterium]